MFEDVQCPVLTHSTMLSFLKGYSRPNDKINSLIKAGHLIRLQRELYLVSDTKFFPKYLIANQLLRPSYVSSYSALQEYVLISESVEVITSVTVGRSKTVSTPVGTFDFHPVPQKYYGIGIQSVVREGLGFLIATKEKALCDLLVASRNNRIQSKSSMQTYLETFLRIDLEDLVDFDLELLHAIAKCGFKSKMITILAQTIEDYQC